MQFDWFTFIAQIVNFLILIGLLQRFLYKPVIKAMDEREEKLASELEQARQTKVEAEELERELENRLNKFEKQKKDLLEDARTQVEDKRKQWLDELRMDIEEIRTQWEEGLETEKKLFLNQLKKQTAEQIIGLLERVLHDLSERNLEQQTVDYFCAKLERLSVSEKERLQHNVQTAGITRATVSSSFEILNKQKHRLTDVLRQIIEADIEVEFEQTDELGFGLDIRMKGWRMSWNLARYLERLGKALDAFFEDQTAIRRETESVD